MAKGKAKAKRKKSTGPRKLTRANYEKILLDLNHRLSKLRKEFQKADDLNFDLLAKVKNVEKDHNEVSHHLDRTLAEKDENIVELEETLEDVKRLQVEEAIEHAANVKQIEWKYMYDSERLRNELQLLQFRKESWEDFKLERNKLMEKVNSLKDRGKKNNQTYKKIIYDLKESSLLERKKLDIEVKNHLDQLILDCMHSSQIRQAAYASRLLRENVKLQGTLQVRIKAVMKLISKSDKAIECQKIFVDEYEAMEQIIKHMKEVAYKKQNIMDKITKRYRSLNSKYVESCRYTSIVKELKPDTNLTDQLDWSVILTNVDKLNEKMDVQEELLQAVIDEHEEQDAEIIRLQQFLAQIKFAVDLAVQSLEEIHQYKPRTLRNAHIYDAIEAKQEDILTQLKDLLGKQKKLPDTPLPTAASSLEPIYKAGCMGLVLPAATSEENTTCKDNASCLMDVEWDYPLYESEETSIQ